MKSLPSDYAARVYGACLGKTVGVYLGRPFEQWTRARIERELGEIDGYVNDRLNHPLVVSDDDLTGTFGFVRALAENGDDENITAATIGDWWRNLLLENKTVLWWGGMGASTEHTAYLRLKAGHRAPASGSIALNGRTVAEQIGSQIFIEGWGLVHPNDPEAAADLARRAGSVSHDGVALDAAVIVATMVAAGFDAEKSLDELLEIAFSFVPADSVLRRGYEGLREVHVRHPDDWRAGMALLEAEYGYDRYPGGCHMVPNHLVILLALIWSGGDFDRAMTIGATAGWDTDCNLANIGAILGVWHGEGAIGPRWRTFADRLLLPTSDPGATVSDVGRETEFIVDTARRMRGERVAPRPRFSFDLPSARGFTADVPLETRDGSLRWTDGVAFTDTDPGEDARRAVGYLVVGGPTLWPGQTVVADGDGEMEIAIRTPDGIVTLGPSPAVVPEGFVLAVGVVARGPVALRSLDWSGRPTTPVHSRKENFLTDDMSHAINRGNGWAFIRNEGSGVAFAGCREWTDLDVTATLTPGMSDEFGLLVRVRGVLRWTGVLFDREGVRLAERRDDAITTLARAPFNWSHEEPIPMTMRAEGRRIVATIGDVRLEGETDVESGFFGFTVTSGLLRVTDVSLG